MLPIFVFPNPNLRCLVHAAVAHDRITVRTFAVPAAETVAATRDAWVMPAAAAAAALAAPVPPIAVTRATPHGALLRLADLPGNPAGCPLPGDALLAEVAQTALVADPALLGRGACSERAEWVVFADRDGRLFAPTNRTLKSHAARAPKAAIYGELRLNSVLTVLMPFPDADFTRATINVKASPACGIVQDAAVAYAVEADGHAVAGLVPRPPGQPPFRWPQLQLTVPAQLAADAFADIGIRLVDGDGAALTESGPLVYLESHAGYLPRRRVALVDGAATVRIGALGLVAGDRLHLKAGWRYFPGLAEAEIEIV